jgi:tRNA threonylcarbamoyladenosine biosynthesis protein TsaB
VLILAVDTTTTRASVALVEGEELRAEVRLTSESHSRHLVPSIEFLLEQSGLAPSAVEGHAVTVGPGSFTGLRVGISTVQGLALAAGRLCAGISALDALAAAAAAAGAADRIVAVVDAYRGEVYAGEYDGHGRPVAPPALLTPQGLVAGLGAPAAFVGDGAVRYRAEIEAALPGARFPVRDLFLAAEVGRLGARRLAAGEGLAPSALRPLYLRDADIRRASA